MIQTRDLVSDELAFHCQGPDRKRRLQHGVGDIARNVTIIKCEHVTLSVLHWQGVFEQVT
jgi:hypothetical protein